MEAYKQEFIEFMMSADVLRFGGVKTKSGRLSPYFVNTGNYRTGSQKGGSIETFSPIDRLYQS